MTEAQQSLLERGLKEEARVRIAKVSDDVSFRSRPKCKVISSCSQDFRVHPRKKFAKRQRNVALANVVKILMISLKPFFKIGKPSSTFSHSSAQVCPTGIFLIGCTQN